MKTIETGELFEHLSAFLKKKGVELQEGVYTARVRKGCSLLTEVINGTQEGLQQAKTKVDRALDQMRQVIHEKTAPRETAAPPPEPSVPPASGGSAPGAARPRSARRRAPKRPAPGRVSKRKKKS